MDSSTQFLFDKEKEAGVYKLPSGLLFKVLNKGIGTASPQLATPCTCHYEGKLVSGKVFDSSYARGSPIDFAPNQVIKGWTEALQLMREGDKWEVTLPSNIAYGARGAPGAIPPHSTLVFVMELIKVKGASTPIAEADKVFTAHFGKTYAEL